MRRVAGILLICAGVVSAFLLGWLARENEQVTGALRGLIRPAIEAAPMPERPAGEWQPFVARSSAAISDSDREMLASIGYSGAGEVADAAAGVTQLDEERSQPGLNLYISGHAPEAVLMDARGRTVHRWAHEFDDLWPDYDPPRYVRITGQHYWRRVHAFPNGDLLALHEGIGLVKLDLESNVIWKRRDNFHHDMAVADDGRIFALNRTMKPIDAPPGGEPFLMEPVLSILHAEGAELERIPLIACFENSAYAPLLRGLPNSGDLFHENTIQVFDGSLSDRSPLFARGNVLISIWTLDALAIIDPAARRVVWTMSGLWHRQHESQLLPLGNMIVFDNRGNGGNSRILEFDPFTQQIAWMYSPTQAADFHSEWCGGLERLANGNTLITETNNGRAFEVTASGEVVWEFINPHRVEVNGVDMIASLWKVSRVPENYGADWLEASDGR